MPAKKPTRKSEPAAEKRKLQITADGFDYFAQMLARLHSDMKAISARMRDEGIDEIDVMKWRTGLNAVEDIQGLIDGAAGELEKASPKKDELLAKLKAFVDQDSPSYAASSVAVGAA